MIYVDDYRHRHQVGAILRHWSHLFAVPRNDILLHDFAQSIGLRPGWFQPESYPHYDVTEAMRKLAIRRGATTVTSREGARLRLSEKRETTEDTAG